MKILITGANGYIGKSLYSALKDKYEVTTITRKEVDLTNNSSVNLFFLGEKYDVVIHCATAGATNTRDTDWSIADNNLTMYYNLLQNKNHFTKLINLGSGAEVYLSETPYGLSKKVIANSVLDKNNFYNLRIFGVFDENELDTRFIKANIKRYINKEPLLIHQNRYMDFIYMSDLIKIVDYYINNEGPKELNCNYNIQYNLENIADIINDLSDYKVEIKTIEDGLGEMYVGSFYDLFFSFVGLEQGIKEVYNKLK
jgi:UDP-glucose 4-epimerase